MSKIIPITGNFENPYAMLASIAETPDIEAFAIFVIHKDDVVKMGHIKMTRANMAYASLAMGREAIEND